MAQSYSLADLPSFGQAYTLMYINKEPTKLLNYFKHIKTTDYSDFKFEFRNWNGTFFVINKNGTASEFCVITQRQNLSPRFKRDPKDEIVASVHRTYPTFNVAKRMTKDEFNTVLKNKDNLIFFTRSNEPTERIKELMEVIQKYKVDPWSD